MDHLPEPVDGLDFQRRGELGVAVDLAGRTIYTLGPGFVEAFEACRQRLSCPQAMQRFKERFRLEMTAATVLLRGCLAECFRQGLMKEVEGETFAGPRRREFLPVALRAGLNGPRDIRVAAIPAPPPWRPEIRQPSARKRP